MFLASFAVFRFGPDLVHAFYQSMTPDSVMQNQRTEYSRLDNSELKLTADARTDVEKKKYKLFLWFHARGFPIDEGDTPTPIWQPWTELIEYWEGDDGSRFFLSQPAVKSADTSK
jgi:hypothetical protein